MKDDVKHHKMADAALRDIAAEADAAFSAGPRQAQPFTARYPDLTMDDAYRVTALANGMRVAQGLQAGRPQDRLHQPHDVAEYGVYAPNWGYVDQRHHVRSGDNKRLALRRFS